LLGAVLAGIFIIGIVGWASTTELAGAVISNGVVIVDSRVKKVQHPTGGIVGELFVRDDDHVEAGAVVARLDDTQTKANLAVFTKTLDELYARQARLEAEKISGEAINFPRELSARETFDPQVAHVLEGERKLFDLRAEARNGQKSQLRERADQLREEIGGLTEQIGAKSNEISLIKEELKGVMDLWEKKLVSIARVTALKRDAARLAGERGQLLAAKAAAGGKIAEVELQIIQIDQDARSKAAEELSEVRAKIAELSERKIAAEDQLNHIDIRAPKSGRVHELAVHTVGGVITGGETIMLIVPDDDALSIEAKVSPNDIDDLQPGQPARLRFSAFNARNTPELDGLVNWISADQTRDDRDGTPYYTVQISIPDSEMSGVEELKLIPGMPVEVFFETRSRTLLSYLVKPLTDQIMRTFREQ
jgi:HlyD family secretion protein